MDLVFLAPLLAVSVLPQYGHLCGLPGGISDHLTGPV